jgi:hypothetical protein
MSFEVLASEPALIFLCVVTLLYCAVVVWWCWSAK